MTSGLEMLDNDLFTTSHSKQKLTQREKRENQFKHAKANNREPKHILDMMSQEFHALQKADHTLECVREAAVASYQKSATNRVRHAPLIPLPVIPEPFKRIAMDIVGPLPRSRSGKRYILVICDYATRYPEAVPLKSTDAPQVAKN